MKWNLALRLSAIVSLLSIMPVLGSCSDDKNELDPNVPDPNAKFIVDEKDLVQNVSAAGLTFTIPVYTTLTNSQWQVACSEAWVTASKGNGENGETPLTVRVGANSGATREATVTMSYGSKQYVMNVRQSGTGDIPDEGDFRVKVTGAKASSEQPNEEIGFSYDDNLSTMYHSHWQNTRLPVTLEYFFSGTEEIDYIEYVPRTEGTNGNFGQFSVSVATDAAHSDYKLVGDYDFKESSVANRVFFEKGVKATGIKFVVKSGAGNFVSCAEMRFWRRNTDKTFEKKLLTVFKDITCSELKEGVGETQISAIGNDMFENLARTLMNGSYDPVEKLIRIHEYEPYSEPTEWSRKLMTKIYSNLDNPMGVHVRKGDRVIMCVGPTNGHNISVMCVGEHKPSNSNDYAMPDVSGPSYMLNEGVNVLDMTSEGQLFLIYNAAPTEPKIKIHVPVGANNGAFAGYFDLKEHKTDDMYRKIVSKATHKYFVVKGDRMMFMFHRANLTCPSMVNAIETWDQIVKWQQDFMGIDDVRPSQWNNHLMAVSMEGSYMWASNFRMGFVTTALPKILDYDNLMAAEDNAWGPSHEMGHVNQPAINWASTTESSNNLFSNYVLYRFGKYKSRGKGLMHRFKAVYELGECWVNFGVSSGNGIYQGEDAELHMRMNWQLWNYFHRVLGDEKFFSRVFKRMRDVGLDEYADPGRKQLEYAKACSYAANADLTDFFAAWGFLSPINTKVDQYGTYNYVVTQSMIDQAKEYMSKFPKPKHAFEYIEDRQVSDFNPSDYRYATVGDVGYYSTYSANKKLSATISATVNGRNVTVSNGKEAVAFEIRALKADGSYGEIRYVSNFLKFSIPASISLTNTALYAVQADGSRHQLARFQ